MAGGAAGQGGRALFNQGKLESQQAITISTNKVDMA
jgi:hypothetical protein